MALVLVSCKDQHEPLIQSNKDSIDLLRAEFEKLTGYKQADEYLLTPAFRTKVNWGKTVHKGKDTVLINITVLDTVFYPLNGSELNLKDNVILKAVRNKKSEWSFATVIFVPTDLTNGYSGVILSRSLPNNVERIRYFNKGRREENKTVITRKFANTNRKTQAISKLRAGCTYAYVNGYLVRVNCPPPEPGGLIDDEDPGLGQPGDYFPPGYGGGTTSPTSAEDKEIIDSLQGYPCAQAILAQVPNLENEVSAWLNAVFNNNTDFNITFSDNPKLAGTKTDAEHRGFGSVNGQTHKITINPDVLNNASKEYIVATMFHEVLHGFLGSELLRLSAEGKANQFGVLYAGWCSVQINGQQRFVKNHASFGSQLDKLKKAIKSFNPNLSEYDALALAKNGIVTSLDAVETSVNDNHRRGKAGTKCTP